MGLCGYRVEWKKARTELTHNVEVTRRLWCCVSEAICWVSLCGYRVELKKARTELTRNVEVIRKLWCCVSEAIR